MKVVVPLGAAATGLALSDLTIVARTLANAAVSQVGATATEITGIAGTYVLDLPNASAPIAIKVTATVSGLWWQDSMCYGAEGLGPATFSAPSTPYLCARAAVKSKLAITASDTSMDTDVDLAIIAASDWIERFCRQTFTLSERTVYFSPGTIDKTTVLAGNTKLLFPFNVVSVTTLHEDDAREYGADTLIDAADYYLRGNALCLYSDGDTRAFRDGERTVRAVVQGGWATIPALLQQATALLATFIFTEGERIKKNVASENVGGASVSYKDDDMPKVVKAMLTSGGFVLMAA